MPGEYFITIIPSRDESVPSHRITSPSRDPLLTFPYRPAHTSARIARSISLARNAPVSQKFGARVIIKGSHILEAKEYADTLVESEEGLVYVNGTFVRSSSSLYIYAYIIIGRCTGEGRSTRAHKHTDFASPRLVSIT